MDSNLKTVLHVGCGKLTLEQLPDFFRSGWQEIRVDIDSSVKPDIIASLTDLKPVESNSVDAVYSAHNVEHLYSHEVPVALAEFYRVLVDRGLVFITLPDIEAVAESIVNNGFDHVMYQSSMGPIKPVDVLYGHQGAIAGGNTFMSHRTGFSSSTLEKAVAAAGFEEIAVNCLDYALWATGYKKALSSEVL